MYSLICKTDHHDYLYLASVYTDGITPSEYNGTVLVANICAFVRVHEKCDVSFEHTEMNYDGNPVGYSYDNHFPKARDYAITKSYEKLKEQEPRAWYVQVIEQKKNQLDIDYGPPPEKFFLLTCKNHEDEWLPIAQKTKNGIIPPQTDPEKVKALMLAFLDSHDGCDIEYKCVESDKKKNPKRYDPSRKYPNTKTYKNLKSKKPNKWFISIIEED